MADSSLRLKPSRTPQRFSWLVHSTDGSALSGEDKVEMADKMIEIAQRVSGGLADIQITYDTATVTASISAKASDSMTRSAKQKATEIATSGFSGWISRFLLFLLNKGPEAKDELIRQLTHDYLVEELDKATDLLEARILFYVQKGRLHSSQVVH